LYSELEINDKEKEKFCDKLFTSKSDSLKLVSRGLEKIKVIMFLKLIDALTNNFSCTVEQKH
jgi:hypothetical protein